MGDHKYLVAYFSKTNNTKNEAEKLGKILDAPLYRIEEKVPYSKEDLNWTIEDSRATEEHLHSNSRPAIKDKPFDKNFDILLLGFPLWWGEAPQVIRTFLEENEELLQKKQIVLFCTSQMTPIYQTQMNLKFGYPQLKFIGGARVSAFNDAQLQAWTKTFNH